MLSSRDWRLIAFYRQARNQTRSAPGKRGMKDVEFIVLDIPAITSLLELSGVSREEWPEFWRSFEFLHRLDEGLVNVAEFEE